jgi:hypothetical protein
MPFNMDAPYIEESASESGEREINIHCLTLDDAYLLLASLKNTEIGISESLQKLQNPKNTVGPVTGSYLPMQIKELQTKLQRAKQLHFIIEHFATKSIKVSKTH